MKERPTHFKLCTDHAGESLEEFRAGYVRGKKRLRREWLDEDEVVAAELGMAMALLNPGEGFIAWLSAPANDSYWTAMATRERAILRAWFAKQGLPGAIDFNTSEVDTDPPTRVWSVVYHPERKTPKQAPRGLTAYGKRTAAPAEPVDLVRAWAEETVAKHPAAHRRSIVSWQR